jgi:hypothetical protein
MKITLFFSNILTIINMFSLPVIYLLCRQNYYEFVKQRPLKYSIILILLGITSTVIGGVLAGIHPWTSYFL